MRFHFFTALGAIAVTGILTGCTSPAQQSVGFSGLGNEAGTNGNYQIQRQYGGPTSNLASNPTLTPAVSSQAGSYAAIPAGGAGVAGLSQGVVLTPQARRLPFVGATQSKIYIDERGERSGSAVDSVRADCKLQSSAFTATLSVPGTIELPSFGEQTPPMKISCVEQGRTNPRTYQRTIKSVNRSQQQRTGNAVVSTVAFGLVGALAASSANAVTDKTRDVYGYPSQIKLQ